MWKGCKDGLSEGGQAEARRGHEKFASGTEVFKKDMLGLSERSYQKEWKEGRKEGSCEPRDGTAWDMRIKEIMIIQMDATRSRAEDRHRKRTNRDA